MRCTNTRSGSEHQGRLDGDKLYITGVDLLPGANDIEVVATRADASEGLAALKLELTADVGYAMSFAVSPEISNAAPQPIAFDIEASLPSPAKEVLIDANRDGIFEVRTTFTASPTTTIESTGLFKPMVLVRSDDNELVAMDAERVPTIRIVPPITFDPSLSYPDAGNLVVDLDYDSSTRELFVLAQGDGVVRVFDEARSLVRTINLPGVNEASGIGLDDNANLYVCDRAGHRILKLLAPTYFPDPLVGPGGFFGSQGNADGQFESPQDVTAQGPTDAAVIFVADTGNNRLQRFNRAGVHELTITQTGNGDPLTTPTSLSSIPSGGVVLLQEALARYIASNGELLGLFGTFQKGRRITRNDYSGGYVVTDINNVVQQFTNSGYLRQATTLAEDALVAIVLPNPQGPMLIVATAGSTNLSVGVIPQNPPGEGPVAIVQSFLQAVSSGDNQSARKLVADEALAGFDSAQSDATIWTRVQTEGATVANITLIEEAAETAFVRGERAQGQQTIPVDFVLARSETSGRWTLTNF